MTYTTEELQKMFAGCETALNILSEQIGDVDGVAVWYPWDQGRRDPATPETLIDEVQGAWDALPLARDQEPEDLVEQSEIIALQNIARNEGIALRLRWAEIPPVLCRIRGYEILERTAKRWGNSGSVRVPAEDIGKRFVVVRIDP